MSFSLKVQNKDLVFTKSNQVSLIDVKLDLLNEADIDIVPDELDIPLIIWKTSNFLNQIFYLSLFFNL